MLKIHFLNVGHGDCCIIEFPSGRKAVVDVNMTSDMDEDTKKELNEGLAISSIDLMFKNYKDILLEKGYDITLQNPIEYLNGIKISSIFRFICTHPHMDHLTGLTALNDIGFSNIWIIPNEFKPDMDKLSDQQKKDWNLYKEYMNASNGKLNGVTIVSPKEAVVNDFWGPDGIEILAPNDDLISIAKEKNNQNIMSYVFLIRYGQTKIILGGDAEADTWKYLAENKSDLLKDVSILKASHHGRDSGYYESALEIMQPKCTIVSVGKKPNTDASNKYRKHSENVWSTRWKGNIVFECEDNGKITYYSQYDR
jgi:beta-lactamase superfamily II metal-dependent hydrolase